MNLYNTRFGNLNDDLNCWFPVALLALPDLFSLFSLETRSMVLLETIIGRKIHVTY